MAFEQRLEGSAGKSVVGRGNSQCKDPRVGGLHDVLEKQRTKRLGKNEQRGEM